jgi:dihydroxyacetone kinase
MNPGRRGSAAIVAGTPAGVESTRQGGQYRFGLRDHVNPGVKIRPRSTVCQLITALIPLILKSTTPPGSVAIFI